jgi:hypothetical protein
LSEEDGRGQVVTWREFFTPAAASAALAATAVGKIIIILCKNHKIMGEIG